MADNIQGLDGLITASKQIAIAIGLLNQTLSNTFPQTTVTTTGSPATGEFAEFSGATTVTGKTVAQVQTALSMGEAIGGVLKSANMNSTADQAITITVPNGATNYYISGIYITNPSTSLTTAQGGIYAAASKTTPITSGTASTFAYSGLTTHSANASGNLITMATLAYSWNVTTMYLSLTTPQGSAATADIYILIKPLP